MSPAYDSNSDPIFGAEDQQLDFEASEVRLVILQPGSWEDEIECKLRVVGLNEKPRFTAISYYWGRSWSDRDARSVIRIHGHELDIPINLYTGLRRLRHETEEITLWADAISINQRDSAELNDQVARMTQLYRQCEEVRVFLDDATKVNDINAAPDIFLWSAKDVEQGQYEINEENTGKIKNVKRGILTYNKLPKALRHKSDEDPVLGVYHMISMLAQNDHFTSQGSSLRPAHRGRYNILSKLEEIMSLPWWRRQWVVQETVFGKKVILQYKGFICPWEMFGQAALNCREHMQNCCTGHSAGLSPTEREALESFSRVVGDLDYWRKVWDTENNSPMKDRKINLLQLLRQFRTRETSAPKDKIYALLSMVNDWDREDPMRITYGFSDEAVFRDVTSKMISVCKDLSVLMGSTGTLHDGDMDSKTGQRIPSWVTNWSLPPDPRELDRLHRAHLYKAGGTRAPEWRILPGSGQESALELSGFKRDVVSEVAEMMPYEDDNVVADMFEKWEIFLDFHKTAEEPKYRDGTSLREIYWRTICMESIFNGSGPQRNVWLDQDEYRLLGENDNSYQSWMDLIEEMKTMEMNHAFVLSNRTDSLQSTASVDSQHESEPVDIYQAQVDEAIASATASRRLFRTREGFIGLGPSRMVKGDEVWILLGGSMPFLLRTAGERGFKRGVESEQLCHRLVGECYIHGLMHGEALKELEDPARKVWLI